MKYKIIITIIIAVLFTACTIKNKETYVKHGMTWPIEVDGKKYHYSDIEKMLKEDREKGE